MLRVFIDTGARRAEIAGLRWNPGDDDLHDVDLERGLLRVIGKGRRERILPVGAKTVKALDRYIRKRSQHPGARQPWLWLGRKGRMTETASSRPCVGEVNRRVSASSIRTSCGIRSRITGWQMVGLWAT
jgi:site-specific recombinase XerC